MKLDQSSTPTILEYITLNNFFGLDQRLLVAIMMKNIVKKAYGQHTYTHYDEQKRREAESCPGDESDPANWIDQASLQLLQANLVKLVIQATEKKIHSQLLEAIALMSKRYVQQEWPSLLPELQSYLGSGDLHNIRVAMECIKKICKKYRFMFRSDALYLEMNYIIENMSAILLQCLQAATSQLVQEHTAEQH